jgi:hypothetical protein
MSVRAYQLTRTGSAAEPTFNLWHDLELMRLLYPYIPEDFSFLEGGILQFRLADLQTAYAKATSGYTKAVLAAMIEQAQQSPEQQVAYECL